MRGLFSLTYCVTEQTSDASDEILSELVGTLNGALQTNKLDTRKHRLMLGHKNKTNFVDDKGHLLALTSKSACRDTVWNQHKNLLPPSPCSTDTHKERFVEEISESLCEVAHESVRVSEHVEAEQQHVRLLDALRRVVRLHLALQLRPAQQRPRPLEVRHPGRAPTHQSVFCNQNTLT